MIYYQLFCDDYILDDVRTDDYIVSNPKVVFEKNKAGGLTFTIYKTHPYYDKIKIKRSIIELRKNGKAIFRGRVSEYTQEFNLSKNVDVEDILSFFNDSLFEPFNFHGSPVDLLKNVISNHNAQVSEWQQFKIGEIDILDSNDYVYRSSTDYLTSWEIIESRLLNIGGLLRVRYEDDGNYIDWIEGTQQQMNTSTQIVEYGENIVEIKKTNSAIDTYTAILPLGATIEIANDVDVENTDYDDETDSADGEKRLTIEALPNDDSDNIVKKGKWLYSKSAVEKYGWVAVPVNESTWDDVTVDTNLLKKAKDYLINSGIPVSSTIEINAADLSLTDEEINSFSFLDYIKVKSNVHGIDNTFLLSKLELPYKDPQNTKITVGETRLSLVDEQLGNKKQTSENVKRIDKVVNNVNITNTKLNAIIQEMESNYTALLQNSQEIVLQAMQDYVKTGDYETFKQTITTELETRADGITMKFNKITDALTSENGEINRQLTELSRYIRFSASGIELGENNQPTTTTIENGKFAIKENGEDVAYVEKYKMHIKDLEVESKLTIGNFAFVPRSNGNLSFMKVK